jgi:hypothetical protein
MSRLVNAGVGGAHTYPLYLRRYPQSANGYYMHELFCSMFNSVFAHATCWGRSGGHSVDTYGWRAQAVSQTLPL